MILFDNVLQFFHYKRVISLINETDLSHRFGVFLSAEAHLL